MQSLSNCQWHFFTELEKITYSLYGNTVNPEEQKQSWERRMILEKSTFHYKATVFKTVW